MSMYLFAFKAYFKDREEIKGIVAADDYGEAVNNINETLTSYNVTSILCSFLAELDENDVAILPNDTNVID